MVPPPLISAEPSQLSFSSMASRPEIQEPNDEEAPKYTSSSSSSSRIIVIPIQENLSKRALDLLFCPSDNVPRLLLDIGCGSGLSGKTLFHVGDYWVGLDISQSMLQVDGDLILRDMAKGLALRRGVFDGAISISALQWLCNAADKSSHDPRKRLKAFFGSLYRSLSRGARAILQVYPENDMQQELILSFAIRAGFAGDVVIDNPHSSESKRVFLVLTSCPPSLYTAKKIPKKFFTSGRHMLNEDPKEGRQWVLDKIRCKRYKEKLFPRLRDIFKHKEQMMIKGNTMCLDL